MNSLTYTQLYNNMKNHFIARQNRITDFNAGSVISSIFESVARVIERLYVETRIGYNNSLRTIPYSLFGFTRKKGLKASTKVQFSIAEISSVDVTIPIGTIIAKDELQFVTTELATIEAGQSTSEPVKAEAKEIGLKYNVPADTIKSIVSIVPENVVGVTNTTNANGGSNDESDADMLSRFKTFINGLQGTSPYGLKSAILNMETIRSVYIRENFPPIDSYNYDVFIDDGTGTITQELINVVTDKINGNQTENNPGYKATGMNFRVTGAIPVEITIAGTVKVYRTDELTAQHDIENNLREEINKLTIGEDVLLTNLILRLRQINYVKDISELTINGEFENFTINDNQVARFLLSDFEVEDA